MSEINIDESWKNILADAFKSSSFARLKQFLLNQKSSAKVLYPPAAQIFSAFNNTPFDKVKVVILGQDPYHRPKQAHGLSFSVNEGVAIPPSLRNIFKELHADIPGFTIPQRGNLSNWAMQGVLLLNATLTVRAGEAGSHQKQGWEDFTDEVIRQLSVKKRHLVFILWGNFAQSKAVYIDPKKHLILRAPHPSPLSAYNGFLGSKPFSKTNKYLIAHGIEPIDWNV